MNSLAALKYCREVLAERKQRDQWQAWFWEIRCKVIDYWIARLERESDGGGPADLTPAERQTIRNSHPLLTGRLSATGTWADTNRSWRAELRSRVGRYLDAVKSRR
jgi:hypothetical protein